MTYSHNGIPKRIAHFLSSAHRHSLSVRIRLIFSSSSVKYQDRDDIYRWFYAQLVSFLLFPLFFISLSLILSVLCHFFRKRMDFAPPLLKEFCLYSLVISYLSWTVIGCARPFLRQEGNVLTPFLTQLILDLQDWLQPVFLISYSSLL